MSETPKNSGPEGAEKPLTFGLENRARIEIFTQALFMAGLAYAVFGFYTPKPELEIAKWALGVPTALRVGNIALSGELRVDRNASTFGFALGMAAAMADGSQEILDSSLRGAQFLSTFLTYVLPGAIAGYGAWITGRPVIRELIHPQVPPIAPKK